MKAWRRITIGSLLGVVGFVLSPLSWWNDMLVNIPLAFAAAFIITYVIHLFIAVTFTQFIAWTVFFYWVTNIVGMYIMHKGAHIARDKKTNSWKQELVIGTAYSIFIILFGVLGNSLDVVNIQASLPNWVIR